MIIHVARDGQTFGTFSPEELHTALAAGTVQASDFGWHEGMTEWRTIGELVPTLASREPQPDKLQPTTSQAQAEASEGERHAEIDRLLAIPTSSSDQIHGRRLIRRVKFVKVDNYTRRREAELEFLHKVARAGGNGVIHMVVRRHPGGYISIQGEAVQIE